MYSIRLSVLLCIPRAQRAIITTLAVFTVCEWKNGREPKTKTKIILMAKLHYYIITRTMATYIIIPDKSQYYRWSKQKHVHFFITYYFDY